MGVVRLNLRPPANIADGSQLRGPVVTVHGLHDVGPRGQPVVVGLRAGRNIWRRPPKPSAWHPGTFSASNHHQRGEGRGTSRMKSIIKLSEWTVPTSVGFEPVTGAAVICLRKLLVGADLILSRPLVQHDVEVVDVDRRHGFPSLIKEPLQAALCSQGGRCQGFPQPVYFYG